MLPPSAATAAALADAQRALLPHAPPGDAPLEWSHVAATADALAARLRDPAARSAAAATPLAQAVAQLLLQAAAQLAAADGDPSALLPALTSLGALYRVAANLVADADDNRAALLDAGYAASADAGVQALLALAKRYPGAGFPGEQFLRNAVASLLNIAYGGEEFVRRLVAVPELATTVLRVAAPLRGDHQPAVHVPAHKSSDVAATAASWAWQLLLELLPAALAEPQREHQNALPDPSPDPDPELGLAVAQAGASVLEAFLSVSPGGTQPERGDASTMSQDADLLSSASKVLEDAADRSTAFRLAMLAPPESGSKTGIEVLLDFVERCNPPQAWPRPCPTTVAETQHGSEPDDEAYAARKAFVLAKGAVGRALVITAGEDQLMERLFDEEAGVLPRVFTWLKGAATSTVDGQTGLGDRPDMAMLSMLILGNVTRSDSKVQSLAERGVGKEAAAILSKALATKATEAQEADEDVNSQAGPNMQVVFGALSLLKNLAVPPLSEVRGQLIQVGTVPLAGQLLATRYDLARPVQQVATGLIKMLVQDDTHAAVQVAGGAMLDDLAALAARSDDTRSKMQSARAVAATVRSVLRPQGTAGVDQNEVQQAKARLGRHIVVKCLAQLLVDGQQAQHEVLEAEAILGLTLIASHIRPNGADTVAQTLSPSQKDVAGQEAIAALIAPPATAAFRRQNGPRANACALVLTLLQLPPGVAEPSASEELSTIDTTNTSPSAEDARRRLATALLPALEQAQQDPEPVGPAAQVALAVARPWAADQ